MGIDKVVLVSTVADIQTEIDPARKNYGLLMLEEGLRTEGIEDIELFPEKKIINVSANLDACFENYQPDFHEINPELVYSFERYLNNKIKEDESAIIGISVYSDRYNLAIELAKVARRFAQKRETKIKIVAGSHHFKNEKLIDKQGNRIKTTMELVLEERLEDGTPVFDAVFVGKGDSFVRYVKADAVEDIIFEGLYYRQGEKIVGKGVGKKTKVENIPVIHETENEITHASIMTTEYCPNSCGYCSILKRKERFSSDRVIEALSKVALGTKILSLEFIDSAPLRKEDIGYYDKILRSLWEQKIPTSVHGYIDPQVFVGDKNIKEFALFCNRYFSSGFFIGRDCVDADVAEKIGRRYGETIDGKKVVRTRTQEDLDNERKAIIRLIGLFNSPYYRMPESRMKISYILTPFDTYESQFKMLEEAQLLQEMTGEKCKVETHFWMLTPFPGTEVRRRYIQHIVEPEDFHNISVFANCWSYDLGPQVYFMDKALQLRFTKTQEHVKDREYYDAMRQALDDAYSGKLQQIPQRQRRLIP